MIALHEIQYENKRSCHPDRCDPNYLRWVQGSLNRLLGVKLNEDGIPGQKTRSAIRTFQQRHGLKPDSTVGPQTEKTLISAGASQPPAIKEMPCAPTSAQDLIKLLNQYRGDIPLDFLLGWIEIESGRRIDSITNLCERGYFQIHPDQSKDFGIAQHQRLSYDPDYSVSSGIKIVRLMIGKTEALAKAYGFTKDSDLFWGMAKLHHWLPSGPKTLLDLMQRRGVRPVNWETVKKFVYAAKDLHINGFDPKKGILNADKTLQSAARWSQQIGSSPKQKAPAQGKPTGQVPQAQPSSGKAPLLLGAESVPPSRTLYLSIPLGAEQPAKPMTGVFIPKGFVPRPEVDVIVYLHGVKPYPELTIDRYWNKQHFPYWPLREGLNDSRKSAILVAPTLGPRSQGQTGWLTKTGGLDKLLGQVLEALTVNGLYQIKPRLGKLILASHSGGGMPMRVLALAHNDCAGKIKECWGFDCTYFDADPPDWPRWAKSRPEAKLCLYYRPKSPTESRAIKIKKLGIPNIFVLTSPVEHNQVPIRHWGERLRDATFLTPMDN